MNNFKKIIILILTLILATSLLGCQEHSGTPKLKEYIEIISIKEIEDNKYEIEYDLKKDFKKGSGQITQTIYFNDGTKNYPLISDKKGKQKLILTGSNVNLIFSSGNRYSEEIKNININDR